MKLSIYLCAIGYLAIISIASANNVQIASLSYDNDLNQVTFNLSWENSWRSGSDFHDAVWVFVKYKPNNTDAWSHANITAGTPGSGLEIVTQSDNKGVFVRSSGNYSGNISATSITLTLGTLNGPFPDIKVFGIEMVYIPSGSFYMGDGSSTASLGTYSSGAGDVNAPYQITNSGLINVGTTDGYLHSLGATLPPGANIPATFPNGFDAFYCMKYEATQEQYKEFLNTLDRTQQNTRTQTDISGTSITNQGVMTNTTGVSFRAGIKCAATLPASGAINFYNDFDDDGTFDETSDGYGIPCHYISGSDIMAYLDWAALRPMTEFEYEKVCRGSSMPVTGEYAWGTTEITEANFISNSGTSSEGAIESGNGLCNYPGTSTRPWGPMRNGFAASSSTNRSQSGGSYYGVMEMTGNLVEPVVLTATSSVLTNFDGTAGDGILDSNGNQDAWTDLTSLYARGGSWSTANQLMAVSERSPSGSQTLRFATFGIRGVR